MYSLNAPVPGRVHQLASSLYPELRAFERVREEHSLLAKRFSDDDRRSEDRRAVDDRRFDSVEQRVRRALSGAPAFEAAVTGIDYFEAPPSGTAPVVYLAVESPGLERIHRRLVEEFGAFEGLEGEDYVPHVTLAREGDVADAEQVVDRAVERIEWTVGELYFKDARYDGTIGTISLPA